MKRILTIQDISCIGKCSLTVALPIISAMGVETAVLPTAVLSTHTAFQGFTFRDLTDDIPAIAAHWKKEGFSFDALYTGYLGSQRQIDLVRGLFRDFAANEKEPICLPLSAAASLTSADAAASSNAETPALSDAAPTLFSAARPLRFVDPAMADGGSLYSGFTTAFAQAMASLCAEADVIAPNLTEACLMTGVAYREDSDEAFAMELLQKLAVRLRALWQNSAETAAAASPAPAAPHAKNEADSAANGTLSAPASDSAPRSPRYLVLTGAHRGRGDLGALCYDAIAGRFFSCYTEKLPVKFHGTGDIFASCAVGALTRGLSIEEALRLAVDYTRECIRLTMDDPGHRWYGVNFEAALPYLMEKMKRNA